MKNTKVLAVLHAIAAWHSGEEPISTLCTLLGDDTNEVGQMLMLNGIADFSYKPTGDFPFETVVNAVLLYLAMRQDIRIDQKRKS